MRVRSWVAVGLLVAGTLLAACGDTTEASDTSGDDPLVVYSGREEEYVEGLLDDFENDEGIDLEVRYGDSAELAATLLEEGDSSPADVFFSQDAGSLGAVSEGGLFRELEPETLARVEPQFRSPEGTWIGTSARVRVAAYNTEALTPGELPDSIHGFTDPSWKGRFGFPPGNSSFQASIAAMILLEGEDATRTFLEELKANEPVTHFEDNEATTLAVADGEIDVGLVNHYYIYEVAREEGDIPVANHFFSGGDPGGLVNAAGVGVMEETDQPEEAQVLVDYLTGEPGQTYFPAELVEYPVVADYGTPEDLVPLDEIDAPDLDLSELGATLAPAQQLLLEVGLL
jgi:iron(III) transport system substrate-binding protein